MPRGQRYPEAMREEARRLRREGWSLGEIAKKLGPPKNTLIGWVGGIELSTTVVIPLQKRIVVLHSRFCPRCPISAIAGTGYTPFARAETDREAHANHSPSPSAR